VNHARREANKADGVIILNPRGKDAVEKRFKVGLGETGEIKGQSELLELSLDLMRTYGPNTAILGKGEGVNSQSGRAILALQQAGLTELSAVFERHREMKLSSYKRDWQLAKQFYTQEKVIPILDEGAENGIRHLRVNQLQFDPMTGGASMKNDVARIDVDFLLDEGPDTITQTEEMMDFVSKLGEAATGPAGRLMIELSNLRNKKRLIKILDEMQPKADPEVQDLEKRMRLLQVSKAAVDVDKAYAETIGIHTNSLATLATNGIPSSALQAAPFDLGVNTFLEDVLGQEIHPMGNAFDFQPAPQVEQVPMMDGPPGAPDMQGKPTPGAPMPAMERPAPQHQIVPTGNGQAKPPLGVDTSSGDAGGLPMGNNTPMQSALMPPEGTRI
jgi:hypothetical protein